jgi:hypothetical protein
MIYIPASLTNLLQLFSSQPQMQEARLGCAKHQDRFGNSSVLQGIKARALAGQGGHCFDHTRAPDGHGRKTRPYGWTAKHCVQP